LEKVAQGGANQRKKKPVMLQVRKDRKWGVKKGGGGKKKTREASSC